MIEVTTDEFSDSHFYRKVLKIGTPIVLAQLMTSLLGLIDTFMVADLGTKAVTAVGASTSFTFLLFMILFGFLSGLSIFIAQYWGSKDIKSIHKVYLISLVIGAVISTMFFIISFFFPEFVIGLYNNSGNAANRLMIENYGVEYLHVAAFSYFTMTISFTISMWMRNVEKVLYPQIIAIIVVILNTLLNYALISGNFGFNAYGVEGAAIATLTSSGLGSLLLIGYLFKSKEEVFKIKFRTMKEITKEFLRKIFSKALPVAINETMWGLGMTFFLMAYGYISTNSLASVHVSNQVMGLFWVINAGISTACAIMIGNKLGEDKLELAKKWGQKFTKLTLKAGVLFGIILFILSGFIAEAFTNNLGEITEEERAVILENVTLILKVFSFYIPIKFSNALQIIGTLRAGGDTKFVLFAELGPLWLVGVPLAFILSIYTTLPLYMIIAIVNVEELIKFFLVLGRFFQYKWVRNLTTT